MKIFDESVRVASFYIFTFALSLSLSLTHTHTHTHIFPLETGFSKNCQRNFPHFSNIKNLTRIHEGITELRYDL